jgi:hypothetical protein
MPTRRTSAACENGWTACLGEQKHQITGGQASTRDRDQRKDLRSIFHADIPVQRAFSDLTDLGAPSCSLSQAFKHWGADSAVLP